MSYKTDRVRLAKNRALVRSALLCEWDPIGIAGISEAKDEYDTYADVVFSMLVNQNATADDIAHYLFKIATEEMRLSDRGMLNLCSKAARAVVRLQSDF